ncbi:MAG: hypothetical protein ABI876_14860 [Bacteroidota bacterium]
MEIFRIIAGFVSEPFWKFLTSLVSAGQGCFPQIMRFLGVALVVCIALSIPMWIYQSCNNSLTNRSINSATETLCDCLKHSKGDPDKIDSCVENSSALSLGKLSDMDYARGLSKAILGEACGRSSLLSGWSARLSSFGGDADEGGQGVMALDSTPILATVQSSTNYISEGIDIVLSAKILILKKFTRKRDVRVYLSFVSESGSPMAGVDEAQLDYDDHERIKSLLEKGSGSVWVHFRQSIGSDGLGFDMKRIDRVLSSLAEKIRLLPNQRVILHMAPNR